MCKQCVQDALLPTHAQEQPLKRGFALMQCTIACNSDLVVQLGNRLPPPNEKKTKKTSVYNHWTGLVDWTGGLTLKIIFQ